MQCSLSSDKFVVNGYSRYTQWKLYIRALTAVSRPTDLRHLSKDKLGSAQAQDIAHIKVQINCLYHSCLASQMDQKQCHQHTDERRKELVFNQQCTYLSHRMCLANSCKINPDPNRLLQRRLSLACHSAVSSDFRRSSTLLVMRFKKFDHMSIAIQDQLVLGFRRACQIQTLHPCS